MTRSTDRKGGHVVTNLHALTERLLELFISNNLLQGYRIKTYNTLD